MNYAILRTRKLKSMGAVSRSARHTHREQPTPNADPTKTYLNRTAGAKGAGQILAVLERTLPTKRRKDAVLAIEYLVTASPEAFKRHGGPLNEMGDGYFKDALKWLRDKHGKANVISATIHLDESTPHMVAYVVPMTADKRLSCRDFLGGRKKLTAMQTDFHAKVGAKRGLARGVEGSKAQHEAVASFYSTLAAQQKAPTLKSRDYASAALGVKTTAWREAEAVAEANAMSATRAERTAKANRSRAQALIRMGERLEQRAETIERQRQALSRDSKRLDAQSIGLSLLQEQLIEAGNSIELLKAQKADLESRLMLLRQTQEKIIGLPGRDEHVPFR